MVNKISLIPYSRNTEVLNIITSKIYYTNGNDQSPLIKLEAHPDTSNFKTLLEKKNKSKRNN